MTTPGEDDQFYDAPESFDLSTGTDRSPGAGLVRRSTGVSPMRSPTSNLSVQPAVSERPGSDLSAARDGAVVGSVVLEVPAGAVTQGTGMLPPASAGLSPVSPELPRASIGSESGGSTALEPGSAAVKSPLAVPELAPRDLPLSAAESADGSWSGTDNTPAVQGDVVLSGTLFPQPQPTESETDAVERKRNTITNLDTGEVVPIDQVDVLIPPNPFSAAAAAAGSAADGVVGATVHTVSASDSSASAPSPPPDADSRRPAVLRLLSRLLGRDRPASPDAGPQRMDSGVRVEVNRKLRRELSDLSMVQRLRGHQSSVWVAKFSPCGRFLATAGQDTVLRVWRVAGAADVDAYRADDETESQMSFSPDMAAALRTPNLDGAPGVAAGTAAAGFMPGPPAGAGPAEPASGAPQSGFFDAVPFREYRGHQGDIFDVAWSSSNFLLSASMDHTVRLWHLKRRECLYEFPHVDFVTAVDFHPLDERFFLSGSFDEKIRIWSIPENKVVHWAKARGLVTAASFTRDGAIVMCGLYTGQLCFYQADGLRFTTQIQVRSARGKNSKGKKITGLQLTPDGEHVLVTSADSRIRMYSMTTFSQVFKYAGMSTDDSHIRACLSGGGEYIVCASKDHRVMVWNRIGPPDVQSRSLFRSDRNESYEAFPVVGAVPTAAVFVPPVAAACYTAYELRRAQDALTTPAGGLPAVSRVESAASAAAAAAAAAASGGRVPVPGPGGAGGAGPAPPPSEPLSARSRTSSDVAGARATTPRQARDGPKESLVGAMFLVADYNGELFVYRNAGYPRSVE